MGMELNLPRHETFFELRGEYVGFGTTGDRMDREVFLGFAQVTISRKRSDSFNGPSKGRRRLMLAFLIGLAIPTDFGTAQQPKNDSTASELQQPIEKSEKIIQLEGKG